MAGPWEKYAAPAAAEDGPWSKYATPAPAAASQPEGFAPALGRAVLNAGAGAIRGAGSIGATLMAPMDMLNSAAMGRGANTDMNDRRGDMTAALGGMGADTGSLAFGAGKLGGEIAGTMGAGGAIAGVAGRVLPVGAAPVLDAIRTAGMSSGGVKGASGVGLRALGGGVTGAASAGLVDPGTAAQGGAIGAVLPGAMQAAGKVGTAIGGALRGERMSPAVVALADRAKALGIDIPADRLMNSKPMNAAAATLNYVPFSGRAATEAKMADQLNTALSRTFGQNSSNVTQALRTAGGDLGAKFDTVLQANTVKMTPAFKTALADAENQATDELGAEAASIIHRQIAALQTKGATGAIDGQAAYNIKKTLDRIGNRNAPEAFYARDLKKKLMDALNDSLGPQEAQAFGQLRKQYGNMLTLENLAQNGADGGISVARLANLKHINNPDLQELADISAQFLKGRESPHGAMQRLVIGGTAASLGGAAGLAGMVAAVPAVVGTAAAGRAANAALNSNAARAFALGQPNALMGAAAPDVQQFLLRAAPNALTGR